MMKVICRFLAVLLILWAVILPTSATLSPKDSSLTIHYEPMVCTFRFYKVADFSTENGLRLTEAFARYKEAEPLTRSESHDAEALRRLSSTLEALVIRDALAPTYTAQTSPRGELVLQPIDLGVYLILGEQKQEGEYLYIPAPMLLSVPNRSNGSAWEYHVVAEHNKFQKEPINDDFFDYRVMKIWEDAGNANLRPSYIEVQLWKSGELYDTVRLNAENNWKYQWSNLPKNHIWTVTEAVVPAGYVMSVEKEAKGAVIRNSYRNPPPPSKKLPPTGQLWWPVPVLLVLGVAALLGGCALNKNECFKSEREGDRKR